MLLMVLYIARNEPHDQAAAIRISDLGERSNVPLGLNGKFEREVSMVDIPSASPAVPAPRIVAPTSPEVSGLAAALRSPPAAPRGWLRLPWRAATRRLPWRLRGRL